MTLIMKFTEKASQSSGHCIENRVAGACVFNQISFPLIDQVGLSRFEWCIKNNCSFTKSDFPVLLQLFGHQKNLRWWFAYCGQIKKIKRTSRCTRGPVMIRFLLQ